jgi:hypothetical protein
MTTGSTTAMRAARRTPARKNPPLPTQERRKSLLPAVSAGTRIAWRKPMSMTISAIVCVEKA